VISRHPNAHLSLTGWLVNCTLEQRFEPRRLEPKWLRRGWGWGGGFEPMRESPSSGPSEPRVGLDCFFVLLPFSLPLPKLRRRLCVCACIRIDMFSLSLSMTSTSLSLSLSLVPLDVSVYLSTFSATEQMQVQS
jgi:hypothetical protein